MWTAPPEVGAVRAFGTVKVTTCTSVGGSDDPYDDLPELCGLPQHEIDFAGTTITASFNVGQLAVGGGYCNITQVPASAPNVHVDRDTHHEMIHRMAANVPVATDADCTREFRIKTYIRQQTGASIIVHRQGTLTAVIPR
jgi:hypothetical protein